jgi:signal transduction histidine kinase
MKFISQKNFFQPRARLLLQLGDKLIKNENIALLELIKNSYDADSKKVTVKLEKVTDKKFGRIEIIDDGEGMDMDIIENVWLEPGSDYKADLFARRIRTKKFKRLPIGEKGIGRFGVHKLGNKIELISKQEGKNEVVVQIDWNQFSKSKYLKDAKFDVFERTPEYFLRNRKGTRIIITDLRTDWDRRMIRDLYKSVFTLNSPFQKSGNFKVDITTDNPELIVDLPKFDTIKEFALWYFKCKIAGSEIKEFRYEFIPWENLYEVEGRVITQEDSIISNNSLITRKSKEKPKEEEIINLSRNFSVVEGEQKTIGEISFEGYIFDRERSTLELSNFYGLSLLKGYLDEQGGIKVYRDQVRINEYGDKGNDFLGLNIRRVNRPALRVSNNIILGVVDLKAEESTALVEKTNREGFVENEAYYDFRDAILCTIEKIENLRFQDKELIRLKYNPTEKEEPVLHRLEVLKKLIDKRIQDVPLKNEITKHLAKIEDDYNYINDILLTSAGAGLTLSFGVHEVQKVLSELNIALEKEVVPEKISNLLHHLDQLIENYSDLLRQSDTMDENIIDLLKGAIFNVEYRLEAHQIELVPEYLNYNGEKKLRCSRRLLLSSIINIIDNSIYWLEKKKKKLTESNDFFSKKIFINLLNEGSGFISILIADNGFGFNLPTHQITKPFITSKPDGMGLGLHLVNEIMKTQGGQLCFPEYGDYELPDEFKRGAVVVLKLKSE